MPIQRLTIEIQKTLKPFIVINDSDGRSRQTDESYCQSLQNATRARWPIIIIDIHTRQGAIHEKEEREKEDSREAGSVDQWPAGLCPVANRGLKGSWTDHWPTHVQHRNGKCDIYNKEHDKKDIRSSHGE